MTVWEFLADFFVNAGNWIRNLLMGWGVTPLWAALMVKIFAGLFIAISPLIAVLFLIWDARKVMARIQDRLGPNNSGTWAGPYGLLQSIADAIKIFTKELIIPQGADRAAFIIAPILVLTVAISVWAVIPLGPSGMQGVDLDVGIFYIVAMSSLVPFSMIIAGWSSKNKYAEVGAFRAVSQIVSYEVPLVLSLMVPVMLSGSLSLQSLIKAQHVPFVLAVPLPALINFLSITAEVGRLPFELAEADSEIVAGYFTEYSGIMFGAFYIAEFLNNLSAALIFSVVFLGGWRGPWVDTVPILGAVWLLLKGFIVFNVFVLFWAAMPRLRIDQILSLNWKFLTPLAIVSLLVVGIVDKIAVSYFDLSSEVMNWERALFLLAANVLLGFVTMFLLTWLDRRNRRQDEERRRVYVAQ